MKREWNGLTVSRATYMTESDAIRLARSGDGAGFERLYALYGQQLYSVCLRIAGDPLAAQALAEEVFLSAFRQIRNFNREASFAGWLCHLAMQAGSVAGHDSLSSETGRTGHNSTLTNEGQTYDLETRCSN